MYQALLRDFKEGHLSKALLDERVKRQIALKLRKGLFYKGEWPALEALRNNSYYSKMQKNWVLQEEKAKLQYEEQQRKYKLRGETLSTTIARASIKALPVAFNGISLKDFSKLRFLLASNSLKQQVLNMGIPAKHIQQLPKNHHKQVSFMKKVLFTFSSMVGASPSLTWIIELRPALRSSWNQFVDAQLKGEGARNGEGDIKEAKRNPSVVITKLPRAIGLYSGNPFLALQSSKQYVVLLSASSDNASKAALAYRLLYPKNKISKSEILGSQRL